MKHEQHEQHGNLNHSSSASESSASASAASSDVPVLSFAPGGNGGLPEDASLREVRQGVIKKLKGAVGEAIATEVRVPYYTSLAFSDTLYSRVGGQSLSASFKLLRCEKKKYFFVFQEPSQEGGSLLADVHEGDQTVFTRKEINDGTFFRHYYPRRDKFSGSDWTQLTVFEDKQADPVAEAFANKVPFGKGNAASVLARYRNNTRYEEVFDDTRAQVQALVRQALVREAEEAPSLARKKATQIVGDIFWIGVFGAPAAYLGWHAAMGLASNFGGEVAGAVILGLMALSSIIALGRRSRAHACYTQVAHEKHLKSHLGSTVFALRNGEELAQVPAVEAIAV